MEQKPIETVDSRGYVVYLEKVEILGFSRPCSIIYYLEPKLELNHIINSNGSLSLDIHYSYTLKTRIELISKSKKLKHAYDKVRNFPHISDEEVADMVKNQLMKTSLYVPHDETLVNFLDGLYRNL